MAPRKQYKREKKIAVLQYAQQHGVSAAAKSYEIDDSIIYRWKKKKILDSSSIKIGAGRGAFSYFGSKKAEACEENAW